MGLFFRSEQFFETDAANVVSKCYVRCFKDLETIDAWSQSGEFRFYFTQVYRPDIEECSEPDAYAKTYGKDQGNSQRSCFPQYFVAFKMAISR